MFTPGIELADEYKPIQRICKYPLLFEDLLRETPVYDCPESHAELEKVLYRLRETVREINKATDDPTTRTRVEQTWLLQDRLEFPADTDHMQDQLLRSTMRHKWIAQPRFSHANEIRMLGHVLLCGVLYVAWQGVDYVQGQYLICILFKSILLLATPNKNSKYSILAGLTLGDASMESVSGGRGNTQNLENEPFDNMRQVFSQQTLCFRGRLSLRWRTAYLRCSSVHVHRKRRKSG
jgi:hypothetical protein